MAVNTPPDYGADGREASAPQAYDFARPGKLSPAERKWLGYLHTGLAKRLELALAGPVRDYVEVAPGDLAEMRLSDLVAKLPSPCAVFTFEARPLKGQGLLRVDPALAFALVDRMFGGKGEPADLGREFTPIEQRIVGRFADIVLAEVGSAWKAVLDLKFSRSGFAASPDLVHTARVDEPVIEAGFTLKAGSLNGGFAIAYLHHTFEPALRALSHREQAGEDKPVAEGPPGMVKALSLPVVARLTPTMVDMKHLVDLSVGDVLLLDNRVSDDVEVLVGGKPVMKGRPGSHGGRLAVKITRFSGEGG
jgi:flagellar motor switch protein FliM